MRQGLPFLLLTLSFAMSYVHADEGSPDRTAARQAGLEQTLSENELQRKELSDDPGITDAERAQLTQLRRENRQLRLQLAQPQQTPWLNDQQQWFAIGGGVGVLGFLLGVLITRGRRRRQWLN